MARSGPATEPESLAARLDKLFRSVRRPDGTEFSFREVAEAVTEAGEPISHSYIAQLRSGIKDNPTLRHMRGLARFFGVPVEYFTNDRLAARVDLQLDLLTVLRELEVRHVALRQQVLSGTDEGLSRIAELVQTLRGMAQTPDGGATPVPGARDRGEHDTG